MPLVNIADVKVAGRVRQDMGDLPGLARSIEAVGQLHPIGLGKDNTLLYGGRRLEACKSLGFKQIEAFYPETVGDLRKALLAERDENTCRKELTVREALEMGRRLEAFERELARQRQREGGGDRKSAQAREKIASGNLPEAIKGQSQEKVAAAVGMSRRTYEKAKAVEAAAREDPEAFGAVAEEMEATGRVDPAYRKVRAARKGGGRQEASPDPGTPPEPESGNGEARGPIKSLGVGVARANEAINCLKKIPRDDPLRKRAFEIVKDWIRHNSKKASSCRPG